jgi:uncharacterized protein
VVLVVMACADDPSFVRDVAGLLSQEQRTDLDQQHALLLRDYDIDYRVEISSGVADLSRHAATRFKELGVGSRSGDGLGLLLVLDSTEDRVRLEVGKRLEGHFTDAFVAYLQERQMVPFFRAGRVADGILAATELVVHHVQEAGPLDVVGTTGSAGGGAASEAALGAGPDAITRSGPDVEARETPEETVHAYLAAMRARNGNAALDLYTAATREMFEKWVVTPGQMDSIEKIYRSCKPERARVGPKGQHAVVRYGVEERNCAPWFLVREGGRWRLDLLQSKETIRFGAKNAWHFALQPEANYAFAFSDWRLDRNGFPHAN